MEYSKKNRVHAGEVETGAKTDGKFRSINRKFAETNVKPASEARTYGRQIEVFARLFYNDTR